MENQPVPSCPALGENGEGRQTEKVTSFATQFTSLSKVGRTESTLSCRFERRFVWVFFAWVVAIFEKVAASVNLVDSEQCAGVFSYDGHDPATLYKSAEERYFFDELAGAGLVAKPRCDQFFVADRHFADATRRTCPAAMLNRAGETGLHSLIHFPANFCEGR